MNIIKTGIGISKTIKNVNRTREILSVFARHGFDEFIINTKLHLLIPNFVIPKSRFKISEEQSDYDFWKTIGYRLRESFEELGPSFIKLGQLLATREDILDPALIAELKKLQNKAKSIPFNEAKLRISEEMSLPLNDIFSEIEETPIGVASIGVVYKAKLVSGEDVVIKVRRPKIKKVIINDFEIMDFVVRKLEAASEDIRYLGLSRAIEDFFRNIMLELNFVIEANNNKVIKENLKRIYKEEIFIIPKIYKELSTSKVLVMDYLAGEPFNEIENLDELPKVKENLDQGVKLFLHTMLADGFFHADLHGGNFFRLVDDKIGLIDFGLVGTLSKQNRTSLIAILYAVLTNNYENLVYEFLDIADFEEIPSHEVLVRDLRDALSPYIGMSVKETDVTSLVHSIVSTLSKHRIYLPREWFIIFRALMTLDGVGKSLDIDLNIFEVIDGEIHEIIGELVSKDALIEEASWLGRDVLNSLRIVPRHFKWMLKEFSKKKYVLEISLKDTNKQINYLSRSIYFLGLIILTCSFFISGIIVLGDLKIAHFEDIPVVAYVCWILAGLSFFRASVIYKLK